MHFASIMLNPLPNHMASHTTPSAPPLGRHAQADVATVVDSIRSVVQSLRISGREAEQKLGISGAQLFVLEELANGPALSINELAARTFTHQSSASMVVSRLVERRLVTRMADRGDARKLSISLTAPGRALLKKAPHAVQTTLVEGLRMLSRADLKQLARNLSLLTDIMSDQTAAADERPGVVTRRLKSAQRA